MVCALRGASPKPSVVVGSPLFGGCPSASGDLMVSGMTATAEQVARRLGTSRRRIVAAAGRLRVGRIVAGHWAFSDAEQERLAAELGVDAGGPLPRSQMRVLAELSLRPRGLVSARAVAQACGLAPATASAAVKAL